MSNLRKALRAAFANKLVTFREAVNAELYERAMEEVDAKRIAVAQSLFIETGASPNEKKFVAMHWDKMDKPFNAKGVAGGKPNGVDKKGGKRPADSDEEGFVDLFDDDDYATDKPWGRD